MKVAALSLVLWRSLEYAAWRMVTIHALSRVHAHPTCNAVCCCLSLLLLLIFFGSSLAYYFMLAMPITVIATVRHLTSSHAA